jgi:hypothetical protein
MLDQLTLFAADTPASHFLQPGSARAKLMTVTSGLNLCGSWLNSGPLGSLERMLLGTSAWGSTMCFLTWKDRATPAGRLLFQLAPSVPSTGETEYGPWPTPARRDYISESCTPEFAEKRNQRKVGLPLSWAVKHGKQRFWPTPSAGDDRDRGNLSSPAIQRRAAKGKQLNLSMVVSSESGALNPTWVEWLMGFPEGWTDLKPSETP